MLNPKKKMAVYVRRRTDKKNQDRLVQAVRNPNKVSVIKIMSNFAWR